MSAYVVTDECINAIVTYFTDRRRTWERHQIEEALRKQGVIGETFEQQLGNAMFELNCNAVEQRYGDGQAKEFRELNYAYHAEYLGSAYAVYDQLGTWLYQCSEGDVPESSELYQAMQRLYAHMAHTFFRDLRDHREHEDADIRRDLQQQINELNSLLNKRSGKWGPNGGAR